MWTLLNDPVVMQRFLLRAWHVLLLVGAFYASVTPKFAWTTPIIMILASTSKSPFIGIIPGVGGQFRIPADEISAGRLP